MFKLGGYTGEFCFLFVGVNKSIFLINNYNNINNNYNVEFFLIFWYCKI